MITNIKSTIEAINTKAVSLQPLAHEDVRRTFQSLRQKVMNGEKTIDDVLIDVFALVKEVCRRFSLENNAGVDLGVETSEWDTYISKRVNHIQSYHKWTHYRRQWNVGGVMKRWKMIPYDEQLQGGIELHNGHVLQMNTGEGKTLTTIAPAVLNAMTGQGVHIATANGYLSRRDYEITMPIYSFLGLSVGCIEGLAYNSKRKKEEYARDITFGSCSTFVFDYLFDHLASKTEEIAQRNHAFIIIDEIDSILIDEAQTPHIISGEALSDEDENRAWKDFLPIVKKFLAEKKAECLYVDSKRHKCELTSDGQKWFEDFLKKPALFDRAADDSVIASLKNNASMSEKNRQEALLMEYLSIAQREHIRNIIEQLLTALTVYLCDRDYIVEGQKIIIIDHNTGRPKRNSVWEYGLHEAIETKEFGKPTKKSCTQKGRIAVKNYISLYKKIAGMTGTAQAASEEFREVYGLNVVTIPTHKPMIRHDLPMRIFRTDTMRMDILCKEVQRLHEANMPVLVGTKTIKESNEVRHALSEYGINVQLLNANTINEENSIIDNAGKPGVVTVATSLAGRGTDIVLSEESLNNGGLAVLGYGISHSRRVDEQLIGRSGRQGNPGLSQFFVSLEDEIIEYLGEGEKKELTSITKDDSKEELTSPRIAELVMSAQQQNNAENKKSREHQTAIDDAIAPLRNKVYDIRKQLLGGDATPIALLRELFPDALEPDKAEEYETHKKIVISKSMRIIRYAVKNMHNVEKKHYIPFVYKGNMFAILCNFPKAIESGGASVINDMENSILLNAIDKCWLQFINAINNSRATIDGFLPKWEEIILRHTAELRLQLLKSDVYLLAEQSQTDLFKSKGFILHGRDRQEAAEFDAPCPCGSGKPYGLCHGKGVVVQISRNYNK